MVDLDKLRTVAKRWAPHAAALVAGTVVGATLTTLGVRAAVALGASAGDLVVIASGVVAVVSANAFWWWMRGRHQAADRAAALRRAVRVEGERDRLIRELYAAQERNALLEAANKRLSSGEVIETLTDRLEGQT